MRRAMWLSALRFGIGAGSAFLLLSFGGQIVAAPVSVPALCWAIATSRHRAARVALSFVLVLTVAVVGWFLVYSLVRERQPWILVGPIVASLVAVAGAVWLVRRFPSQRKVMV